MPAAAPTPVPLLRAIARAPKAELHLHLEGAFTWACVRALHPERARLRAQPPWLRRRHPFRHFGQFLDAFKLVAQSSGTPAAIATLTRHALDALAAQNLRYVELIVSTPFHQRLGLSQRAVLEAVASARDAAVQAHGLDARLIYGINRHRLVSDARRDLREALRIAGPKGSGLLAGIDLQGDEREAHDDEFRALFKLARDQGLRLRAHAGELRGPESVRYVVEELGVRHLSHGVRAVEDPRLLDLLQRRGVWLHVCPTSNLLLHVYADYSVHPLPRLLDAGCRVTVNSDDPLLFGVSLTDEFTNLVSRFGMAAAQVCALMQAGFEASLMARKAKQACIAEVGRVFAAVATG